MKTLFHFLVLLILSLPALAQTAPADPTRRIDKNMRKAGSMGLSEVSFTRADSIRFAQGSDVGVYALISVAPGYVIGHNKNNPYVKGSFYRSDSKQLDPLWRIRIENENVITLLGPPLEFFSGQLVLEFLPKTNNP